MSRPVFGRIYELNLRDPAPDEEHPYVGKCQSTIHQRVHGRSTSAHTSALSIARDPWKARILPGRAGYRLLETVLSTGDPAEDDRLLRRAENYWIDRLRPKYNNVRPIRPFANQPQPQRQARANVTITRRRRQRRRFPVRAIAFLSLVVTLTALAARVIALMDLPWPQVPWVASPVLGVLLAYRIHCALRRAVRKVLR